ncbi:MAG: EAL domain-containing protein [Actinobacteria bacterium]|nr:EAL domain-containing protein [Actinomycetota bacterium]MSW78289.1 EAL domain-containing protein [Actinomycetota bacterium]MSX56740.1 EAL domain-containing protein [Actinomycetota bacterium]MSX91928.1 EAL domain-containing protein [Actinomycetota bacterium]MSZ83535.1 EAL domain-containing protein [Actinomycetota bacterium]
MPERRTLLEELGSFAGTLLGPQLDENGRAQELRADIRRIIDEQEYQSVFQPVVDLTTRRVCGYEALTRFDDDTPPDVRFALAQRGVSSKPAVACWS